MFSEIHNAVWQPSPLPTSRTLHSGRVSCCHAAQELRVSTGNRSIMSNPSIAIADEKGPGVWHPMDNVVFYYITSIKMNNAHCHIGKRCLRVLSTAVSLFPETRPRNPCNEWNRNETGNQLRRYCDRYRDSRLLLRDLYDLRVIPICMYGTSCVPLGT